MTFNCNRFCGENECNEKQNENPMLCKRVTDKLHIEQPSEEFKFWYERHFLQSPSLCKLEYDDEKMWEAWKEGYKLGRNNAFKRKDIPLEIFTIPKEKHIHTMGNHSKQTKKDNE